LNPAYLCPLEGVCNARRPLTGVGRGVISRARAARSRTSPGVERADPAYGRPAAWRAGPEPSIRLLVRVRLRQDRSAERRRLRPRWSLGGRPRASTAKGVIAAERSSRGAAKVKLLLASQPPDCDESIGARRGLRHRRRDPPLTAPVGAFRSRSDATRSVLSAAERSRHARSRSPSDSHRP
jgi:hypothetical protein